MMLDELLQALKNLSRTGWMLRGVPHSEAETVAEHSWESAVLALLVAYKLKEKGYEISPEKAAALALIHDLAESVMGDIPKWTSDACGENREQIERQALNVLPLQGEVKSLLEEWMKQDTLESKVAKAGDYVSTYLQARRYYDQGIKGVREIMESSIKALGKLKKRIPDLTDILRELGLT